MENADVEYVSAGVLSHFDFFKEFDEEEVILPGVSPESFNSLLEFAREIAAIESSMKCELIIPKGPFIKERVGRRNLLAHLPSVANDLAIKIRSLTPAKLSKLTRTAEFLGFTKFVELVVLNETLEILHMPPILIKNRNFERKTANF